jgi:hypothetical protein
MKIRLGRWFKPPVGDPTWFKSLDHPQPRHPRLTAKLEQQAARTRAQRKREARKLLAEAGFGDITILDK